MGADQIAVIRPAVVALLEAASNHEPSAGELCATFTVPECPTIWMQVQLTTINLAFPSSEDPVAFLQSAEIPPLPGLILEHWQPRRFATFRYENGSAENISRFVDRLLATLHDLDPGYPIAVAFEHLT